MNRMKGWVKRRREPKMIRSGLGFIGLVLLIVGCWDPIPSPPLAATSKSLAEAQPQEKAPMHPAFAARQSERDAMVSQQIAGRGVREPRVIQAMKRVPRHHLIPEEHQRWAYNDHPVPIGEGQTISQPYIVAFMTEALHPQPGERILEVGTGSGYQAAVLAEIVAQVYTIEIVEALAERAKKDLTELGYTNIAFRVGDGYAGWPEEAPFDGIIVTAAPPRVPEPLLEQLKVGGRMVIPVGEQRQELVVLERTAQGMVKRDSLPVRFVPMTGEIQRKR